MEPRSRALPSPRHAAGFTAVELMIALAIVTTVLIVAVPLYLRAVDDARVTLAIKELHELQIRIAAHAEEHGSLPPTLDVLVVVPLIDPWGGPYRYSAFAPVEADERDRPRPPRKDRFLVPLNSDYDLFSLGKDGVSSVPLKVQRSRDDIVRANDGAYVGLASSY